MVKLWDENLQLDTVKVISRNELIRGKSFDVYYCGEDNNIDIVSIEDVTGVQDLSALLSAESIADIKSSLKDLLLMRKIRNNISIFSESEINAGFVQQADINRAKGLSNE